MGGVAVVGVERVCDFCVWVLFLIPVQLWGEHVCVGMRGKHSFVVGLLFLPASERGVCGVESGDFFPILQVDFFLPASERGCLWRGKWSLLPLFAGRFFSTHVVTRELRLGRGVSATLVHGY